MSRRIQNDNIRANIDLNVSGAQKKIHELTESTKRLRDQNKSLNREIAVLSRTEGDHSAEIRRLDEAIRGNAETIRNNNAEIGKLENQMNLSGLSAAQLGRRLKNLKRELANTSRSADPQRYRELEREIRNVERAHASATRSSRGFMSSLLSLDKMATAIKGVFMGIGMVIMTQVVGSFKKLANIIMDFERANSKLAAILQTDFDGIARLTEQAKLLGRTTSATAAEVSGLQIELAKLGFIKQDIENMTPAVLKFSKAVDTDLSSAAAFAGAALRIFGKDSSQTEDVLATLAIATTKTSLDFSKLEASMATVGPVANAYGLSLEDTTALLGQLANAGFDASSAATATRNILLNLCDANGDLAKALGAPVKNVDDLAKGLLKLKDEGIDLAKTLELTDKRSVSAFNTFLNSADSLVSLRDSITDVNDQFLHMSATMGDNGAGAWKGFESAVEGLILKFFDFRKVLKNVFNGATDVIQWLGNIVDAFHPLGSALGYIASALGYVIEYVGVFVGWLSKLLTQSTVGKTIINSVVAMWIAYRIAVMLSCSANKEFLKSLIAKIAAIKAEASASGVATKAVSALNNTWKAHPVAFVVAGIALIATAFINLRKELNATETAERAIQEAEKKAIDKYAEKKAKIDSLIISAKNENLAMNERLAAIRKLNSIIPNYNAQIDKTTGKYKASTSALRQYLDALEKKLRYEASMDEYRDLIAQNMKLRKEMMAANKEADDERRANERQSEVYVTSESSNFAAAPAMARNEKRKKAKKAQKVYKDSSDAITAFKKRIDADVKSGYLSTEDPENSNTNEDGIVPDVVTPMRQAAAATHAVVDEIKELKNELKELRKMEPETDEEYAMIEARKSAIRDRLRVLKGKGKNKRQKREAGTYHEDSLDEATAAADDLHQKNLLAINKQKGDISDAEFVIRKNEELIRYCDDLVIALEKLRSETSSTHTMTLDKITAEENKIAAQVLAANQAINEATLKLNKEKHEDNLKLLEIACQAESMAIQRKVNDENSTREAAELYVMDRERKLHEDQLAELRRYYAEVKASDLMGMHQKQESLEALDESIRRKENEILTDTGKWAEKMRTLTLDSTSRSGIMASFELERRKINSEYDEAVRLEAAHGNDTEALEKERKRRISALNFRQREQMRQLKEITGMSWNDEYQRDLDRLKNYHEQGIIEEKAYQKMRLELGVNGAKKYFDFYCKTAGSMFSALQDAEIARSDAKYEVLIQQAKNNGEDTAALEEDKENKKLAIQKKYADVNFAIKVSQIIADTAVSIMKAYADLGPIAGSVAAAMLATTGAVQVITAKAERDKIKHLSPASTASEAASGESAVAQRVLTGFANGGYTGDGGRYEVAGIVHKGEYVVPKPIMADPKVIDAVGVIEAIRQNKVSRSGTEALRSPGRGFADGGFTDSSGSPDFSEFIFTVKELKKALKNLKAYVVFQDIEKSSDTMHRARAPFTRNRNTL